MAARDALMQISSQKSAICNESAMAVHCSMQYISRCKNSGQLLFEPNGVRRALSVANLESP
jgi:hypothetical protein